jgi:hypothetical protein
VVNSGAKLLNLGFCPYSSVVTISGSGYYTLNRESEIVFFYPGPSRPANPLGFLMFLDNPDISVCGKIGEALYKAPRCCGGVWKSDGPDRSTQPSLS